MIPFLFLALAIPTSSGPMDARAYYRELHDSGATWNEGHRFNRVCFGEGESDPFEVTNSFMLVGSWGSSPKTIETQQYVQGEAKTIQTLQRDSDGLGWTQLGELGGRQLRWRFTLSGAGRYHWKFDFPDSPQTSDEFGPSDGGLWSRGKCQLIQ